MRFNGNQPRIMHFERVKVGDRYSVSPEATLGPTQKTSREITRRVKESEQLRSDKLESKRIASQRIQEFESRQCEGSRVDISRVRESTVREFELDSGVIPTVESEINKERVKIK
jgi:hypothetical protein